MKSSQFNLFFPYEGYFVGYNSFSDNYLVLEEMLYEMYDASKRRKDFSELKEVNPQFYENLCNAGFLVDPSLDEVEQVIRFSREKDMDPGDTQFQLHINPTMNCNFKCWYCYETHIKDSKMDEKTIGATKALIRRILDDRPALQSFHLGWFGGEPLLYFKKVMLPILEYAYTEMNSRNVEFTSGMTSNGLLLNPEVIADCKRFNLNFFQITLDGNRERHDKVRFISEGRGSYDAIVANIVEVARNGLTANIRLNISPDTLVGLKDIADDFSHLTPEERRFVRFSMHKVWQETEDISEEIFDARVYFREKGFTVASGTMNSVVNSCYGDHRNHAVVNYNGELFKCTARNFTHENSEGLLLEGGSVQWNEKYEFRMNAKFKNKPCLECPILPMCGGGCSQQAVENAGRDYCVYNFDINKKTEIVKQRFFEILAENE